MKQHTKNSIQVHKAVLAPKVSPLPRRLLHTAFATLLVCAILAGCSSPGAGQVQASLEAPTATLAPTIPPTQAEQVKPSPLPSPSPTAEPSPTPEVSVEEVAQALGEMLPPGITIDRVAAFANGTQEAYNSEGEIIAVNDGTNGWELAPLGLTVRDSTWYLWDNSNPNVPPEWVGQWDYDERREAVALMLDEALVHEENFRPNELQCLAPYLCYHMQVKPEMAKSAYNQFLEALTHSPWLKKYLTGFSLSNASAKDFKDWLQSSLSPDGQSGWLPVKNPRGEIFEYIQGTGGRTGPSKYRQNIHLTDNGGMYLDGLFVMAFSTEDLKNPYKRAYFEWLSVNNYSYDGALITFGAEAYLAHGLVIHPITLRPGYVLVNKQSLADSNSSSAEGLQLGGKDGIYRPMIDDRLLTNWFLAYLGLHSTRLTTDGYLGVVIGSKPFPSALSYIEEIVNEELYFQEQK